MTVLSYRACHDELMKLSVKFNMPRLRLFKTKLREHTVKDLAPKTKPMTAQPQSPMMGEGPELSVGNTGDVGRMIQPPAVRV